MMKIQIKNQHVIDFLKPHLPKGFNEGCLNAIYEIEIIMNDDCSIVNVEESKKEGKMIEEKLEDMCSINIKF